MPGQCRLWLSIGAGAFGLLLSGAALAQKPLPPLPQPAGAPPVPATLQSYKPVTAQQLKQPADGDWLMYRRTYNGWGYSPLAQITPANVAGLKMAWTLETGQVEGHEAPPIVNNGVMFVATPGNQVLAIDAKAGNLLWRYRKLGVGVAVVAGRRCSTSCAAISAPPRRGSTIARAFTEVSRRTP